MAADNWSDDHLERRGDDVEDDWRWVNENWMTRIERRQAGKGEIVG